MKLHRFYVGSRDLVHSFWLDDERLFHQWSRVLRFEVGREVVLFNDQREVRLYRIAKIGNNAVNVILVTEMEPELPARDVYLCFALLKKDKNDWVLQKGTELGVRHFLPLMTERTEKTGFDVLRAEKIVIEAAEQCGRADIPRVREPIKVETAIEELQEEAEILVAEQGGSSLAGLSLTPSRPVAILIGPEGGWSEAEKQVFSDKELRHVSLSGFTLRAETAAIAAVALLQ